MFVNARPQRGEPAFAASQRDKILKLLRDAGPVGVSREALIFEHRWTQAGTRIFELEQIGYVIRHDSRPGQRFVTGMTSLKRATSWMPRVWWSSKCRIEMDSILRSRRQRPRTAIGNLIGIKQNQRRNEKAFAAQWGDSRHLYCRHRPLLQASPVFLFPPCPLNPAYRNRPRHFQLRFATLA